jgi:polyisoprenoid-binding protein YceI
MAQRPTADSEQVETAMNVYVIDTRASRFTVRAFATGILSAMGHNPTFSIRDFSGEVEFDPGKPEASRFRLAIKASSLSVQDDISSKDRREIERIVNEEVLETAAFPEISYAAQQITVEKSSETIYSANVDGQLTLHGVTRRQPILVRVALLGSMIRASGDFSLNQTDFHIKLVSVAGGALKVKDELRFSFEMVARSQS